MTLDESIRNDEIVRVFVNPAKITQILDRFNTQLKDYSRRIQTLEDRQSELIFRTEYLSDISLIRKMNEDSARAIAVRISRLLLFGQSCTHSVK
jgi:hypothetical protein